MTLFPTFFGCASRSVGRREPGTAAPISGEAKIGVGNSENDERRVKPNDGTAAGVPRAEERRHTPSAVRLDPVTMRGRPLATGDRVRGPTVSTPPLRKLLFSATLTSNPEKLAGLDVVNPLIYTAKETGRRGRASGAVEGGGEEHESRRPSQETRRSNLDEVGGDGKGTGRYSTPTTLEETYTVCDSQVRGGGDETLAYICGPRHTCFFLPGTAAMGQGKRCRG